MYLHPLIAREISAGVHRDRLSEAAARRRVRRQRSGAHAMPAVLRIRRARRQPLPVPLMVPDEAA